MLSLSILVAIATLSFVLFFNLGRYLDITTEPKKADIIVSLGGASGNRLARAIELYKRGYSRSGILIYTGKPYFDRNKRDKRTFLLSKGLHPAQFLHISNKECHNTMEELFMIRDFLLQNNLKSVLFITHPFHSRRISLLAEWIAGYQKAGLSWQVSSFPLSWWNRRHYYRNPIARKAAFKEMIKQPYNLLKYSPLTIRYTQYAKKRNDGRWERSLQRISKAFTQRKLSRK